MLDPESAKLLAGVTARANAEVAKVRSLPCWSEGIESDEDAVKLAAESNGSTTCESAGAFETCVFVEDRLRCPRVRVARRRAADFTAYSDRIVASKIPDREAQLLFAASRPEDAIRLLSTDALLTVRRFLEVHRALLVLAGDKGLGKTVATCHAIAKRGGLYLRAPQLSRPGVNIDLASSVPCLGIDQLGRENIASSAHFISVFEEIIDSRYAARLPTILCGNFTRAQFDERYESVIGDRLRGDGEFVWLEGASMRSPAAA